MMSKQLSCHRRMHSICSAECTHSTEVMKPETRFALFSLRISLLRLSCSH